jgi:hypothetical protein
MRSAGVPNQLYSQCRTNQIEPHVTDRAHIMDRTDSTSDGVCHIAERVATDRAWLAYHGRTTGALIPARAYRPGYPA